MPYWPLTLVKRLVKGSKLTPAEMDQDLTDIEGAVNSLKNFFNVALNPDGTLKNNTVGTNAILDRAVTQAKLDFQSGFYAVDAGAVNAMAISFTPPATAYGAGMIFFVKVLVTNTGPVTLKVDSLAPVSVQQVTGGTLGNLVAGNLVGAGVYCFVHDGTQFVCLDPTPLPVGSIKTFDDTNTLDTRIGHTVTFSHGMAPRPFLVQWTLVCQADDAGYVVNDELALEGVWIEEGATTSPEDLGTPWKNDSIIGVAVTPSDAAGFTVVVNSGGTELPLTTTKWKLRARCFIYS